MNEPRYPVPKMGTLKLEQMRAERRFVTASSGLGELVALLSMLGCGILLGMMING